MKYVGDPTSYSQGYGQGVDCSNEPKDSEAAPQSVGEPESPAGNLGAEHPEAGLAVVVAQETRSYATAARQSVKDVAPSWWGPGVRVTDGGRSGVVGTAGTANGGGWIVALDGGDSYVANANPALWSLEVLQAVNDGQIHRIAYDAQRALLRAFGCHYIPSFEELPESTRPSATPKAVNRPELDGIQAVVRAAIVDALARYRQD